MLLLPCRPFSEYLIRFLIAILLSYTVLASPNDTFALTTLDLPTTVTTLDRDAFAKPPTEFRPWLRWWWPGGDVEQDELTREVAVMSAAGFGGAEIQSFAVGMPPDAVPKVFTYGSDEWFGKVGHVLGEAEKYGMRIDLTLGSSWPPGGKHIDPLHSFKQLICSSKLVSGPMLLRELPPPPVEPLYHELGKSLLGLPNTYEPSKMRLMSLLALKRDTVRGIAAPTAVSGISGLSPLPGTVFLEQGAVNLSLYLLPNGTFSWNVPPGEWVVFAFYQGPTGLKPFYAADGDGGLVLDHLDRVSTELQLTAIAEKGKRLFGGHFGKTLRALFVDSPELRTELYWNESFLEQFARRRGYRLESYLPILFRPFQADAYLQNIYSGVQPSFDIAGVGDRVRHDYDRTVAELMLENFVDPISDWALRNAILSRIQPHGGPFDLLTAYGHALIPESEALFGDGKRSFLKIASSAAHLYDRSIVSSEILAFKKRDYMTTPTDIIREANRNFSAGINQLVLHGFPYRYDKGFLAPGWMPFSSPFLPAWSNIGTFASHLNDRDPFWDYMPQITGYLGRAQMVMQAGRAVNSIALYIPLDTQLKNGTPDPAVIRELDRSSYSYDYVNGDLLKGAVIQDGQLSIGSNRYRALVVADTAAIPWELAVKIPEFVKAGLPVIFTGEVPFRSTGLFAFETRDNFVRNEFAVLFGSTLEQVKNSDRFQAGKALFIAESAQLANELGKAFSIDADVVLSSHKGTISTVHRKVGKGDFYFLTNSGDVPLETSVTFAHETRNPELWDLWDGTVKVAPIYQKGCDGITLPVRLEAGAALVIGFETEASFLHVEKTTLAGVERNGDGILSGRAPVPGSYEVWYGNGSRTVVRVGDRLPLVSPIYLQSWELNVQESELFGPVLSRTIQMDKLTDWALLKELKNFSGKGIYSTVVTIPDGYLADGVGVELELGRVNDACTVSINGKVVASLPAGTIRINAAPYLHSGGNRIEVIVTNTLRNRLMGLAADGIGYYKPLLLNPRPAPSGLLGPVLLVPHYRVELNGSLDLATKPLPLGLNVVPVNYPDYTEQDVIDAISKSRELTGNMSLSWFWWDNKSREIRDCAKVTPLVREAQRQQMQVTLQVLSFTAFGEPLLPYNPASFSNAEAKFGFLEQMACLAELHPDFLLVAPEVNFVKEFNPIEFKLFCDFYRDIYRTIKEVSPATQVGVSYQYDYLSESGKWSSIDDVGANQDFIGLTSYFGATPIVPSILYPSKFASVSEVPFDYYSAVRQHIPSEKPVVFTELAWSSYYSRGFENQVDFVRRMPELLSYVNPVNIIWALEYDVIYYTDFLEGLNHIGMLKRDGSAKPVWGETLQLKDKGVYGPRFFNR